MNNFYFKTITASSVQELDEQVNQFLQNKEYTNITFVGGISESAGIKNKQYRQCITYGLSKNMLKDVWPQPRNINTILS